MKIFRSWQLVILDHNHLIIVESNYVVDLARRMQYVKQIACSSYAQMQYATTEIKITNVLHSQQLMLKLRD